MNHDVEGRFSRILLEVKEFLRYPVKDFRLVHYFSRRRFTPLNNSSAILDE
jgi:hypothetical protein